jgi:hypothetical protein
MTTADVSAMEGQLARLQQYLEPTPRATAPSRSRARTRVRELEEAPGEPAAWVRSAPVRARASSSDVRTVLSSAPRGAVLEVVPEAVYRQYNGDDFVPRPTHAIQRSAAVRRHNRDGCIASGPEWKVYRAQKAADEGARQSKNTASERAVWENKRIDLRVAESELAAADGELGQHRVKSLRALIFSRTGRTHKAKNTSKRARRSRRAARRSCPRPRLAPWRSTTRMGCAGVRGVHFFPLLSLTLSLTPLSRPWTRPAGRRNASAPTQYACLTAWARCTATRHESDSEQGTGLARPA